MTDADKIMNPEHFGIDPADIWIRIRINPEIRIRIPDHFRLMLDPWRRLRSLSTFYTVCTTLLNFAIGWTVCGQPHPGHNSMMPVLSFSLLNV